jgi:flagellar biogenesis protein FliO
MEATMYLNSFLALLFILGLIMLLGWFVKKFNLYGMENVKGEQSRLSISSVIRVDPKRRLVLVKRDDVEHLLLVGGEADLLVESNILVKDMPEKSSDAEDKS